jgi:hypothetical protein
MRILFTTCASSYSFVNCLQSNDEAPESSIHAVGEFSSFGLASSTRAHSSGSLRPFPLGCHLRVQFPAVPCQMSFLPTMLEFSGLFGIDIAFDLVFLFL